MVGPMQAAVDDEPDLIASTGSAASPTRLWWLVDRGLGLALSALSGMVLVGVPLAVVGWYRPLPVAVGVASVTVISMLTRGRRPFIASTRNAPLVALLVLVTVTGAWNVRHSSEHFATNRDPGVYAAASLGVADEGDLLLTGEQGPFLAVPELAAHGSGFYQSPDEGEIYTQFAHLTTILHASAEWIGGLTALTRLNALIGVVGLIAFFAFARDRLSEWSAVAATAALGLCLPQIHVTRDAFSEPVSQLLMVAGTLEIIRAWRTQRVEHAVAGGVLLGGLITARVDGFLLLGPLVMLAGMALVARRTGRLPSVRPVVGAILGAGVPAIIGFVQLDQRSPVYLHDVWAETRQAMLIALAAAIAIGVGVALWPRLSPLWQRALTHREQVGVAATMATVAALQFLWFVRPHFESRSEPGYPLVAGLQGVEGVPVDAARTYAESSMVWLSWYLGPVTLALAIAGAGIITWRVVVDGRTDWVPVMLLLGTTTAAYLWRPSIVPDQIWAMRRFVPQTFPLVVLLAFVAVDAVRARDRWGPRISGLLALGVLLPIVATTLPLRATKTDYFTNDDIRSACEAIGDDAAVVIIDRGNLGRILSNPIRFGCDVPVAYVAADATIDWPDLAAAWREEDRQLLVVVSAGMELPPGELIDTTMVHEQRLERTIERRPETFVASSVVLEIRSFSS